ncbi:MAG: hypothetical protein KAX82_00200 [Burkholderiales bacterium]|jgi:hypothetical protein|nr:hypothetical protein [Burkholderiales bacterium]
MLDWYAGEIVRCQTANLINQLHIMLENTLAPVELCALIDEWRERGTTLPPPAAHWLGSVDTLLRGGGQPAQPYERRMINKSAAVFAAPGTEAERSGRTVVVAFTGTAHRLMMPIALFLQQCPADRYEFLILRDFRRSRYLRGIEGLGSDFPETLERIRTLIPAPNDGRVVSLGISAGGLAAIWAAIELGLPRAVSVCGVTPDEIGGRVQTQGMSAPGFDEAIRRNAGRLPEVLLVAGEQNDRDNRRALSMAGRLRATLIGVPNCAIHNVLHALWSRGELRPFLARLLEPGVVPPG